MDGQRFDEIAKLIGNGASRRRVIKGLTGALLGLSGLAGARSALAGDNCQIQGGECDGEVTCCGELICMSGSGTCESCREIDASCGGDWECCSGSCNPGSETCVAVEEPICAGIFGDCSELPCCGDGLCASNEFGSSICFRPDECPFPGESCAKGYCCSSTCVDNLCTAICSDTPGAECVTNDDCCSEDGLGCVLGICTLDVCITEGEACGAGMICCESLECTESVCSAPAPVPDCEVDSDCVVINAGSVDSVICCAGVCRELECCIDDDDPNARCGDGETCFEGICQAFCTNDMACNGDACCCEDGSCSGECCPEPPVKLPNTGVADGDGGMSGLLGSALVAGAAAALLGVKLKAADEA